MSDQQLEKEIHQHVTKVKKDLGNLKVDSAAQVSRIEDHVSQSAEALSTRAENGLSQWSEGFQKLRDDAMETAIKATTTAKKDVGHGLSQYNARAMEVVGKVPGGFGNKAVRYPWVAISITLIVGFMLGSFLKLNR